MTAREHDPELVEKAAQAHYEAWSFNAAERNGWSDVPAHNLGMTMAVLDAVADDIARAERERLADAWSAEGRAVMFNAAGGDLTPHQRVGKWLRGGEGT